MASRLDGMVIAQASANQTSEQVLSVPYLAGPARNSMCLYTSVAASSAVTSTSTETLASTSYTLPANTLEPGSRLCIRYQGIATASANTDTLTVKLYIGGLTGTALLAHTATDTAANDVFAGEFYLTCRTAGTGGTIIGYGNHTIVPAATSVAAPKMTIMASTAINTTTTQVIGVGLKWSTTDTADSCRLDILSVDLC